MKKSFLVVLSAVLILNLVVPQSTYAMNKNRIYSEEPLTGIKSPNPKHGEGIIQKTIYNNSKHGDISYEKNIYKSSSSNATFTVGEVAINDEGDGKLSAIGCTAANAIADEIGYTLYIQQWDGYEWMDIREINNTDYNEMEISELHFRNVLRGYNYRIKAVHFVIDNGEQTGDSQYSTYIKVE